MEPRRGLHPDALGVLKVPDCDVDVSQVRLGRWCSCFFKDAAANDADTLNVFAAIAAKAGGIPNPASKS